MKYSSEEMWNRTQQLTSWLNCTQGNKWEKDPYNISLIDFVESRIPRKPSKMLDVGIGTAEPAAICFSNKGHSVYGIDVSHEMIASIRNKYEEIIVNYCNIHRICHEDNFFDVVYCFSSTWYFDHITTAIDEMLRVVRQGGIVVFDIRNTYSVASLKFMFKNIVKHFIPSEIFRRLTGREKIIQIFKM